MDALALTSVTRRYRHTNVLQNASLALPSGEIGALVGDNGAGKTTIVRLVAGLTFPDSGRISVLGGPAGGSSGSLGVLFEDPVVYPHLTVSDNLRMLAGLPPRTPLPAQDVAAFDLGGLLSRRGRALSFGQRRRVTLAALVWRPRSLLVLDEPTNGLDPDGVTAFRERIRHVAGQGRSILVTGQDLVTFDDLVATVFHLDAGHVTTHRDWQDRRRKLAATLTVKTSKPLPLADLARRQGLGPDMVTGGLEIRGENSRLQALVARFAEFPDADIREIALRESSLADLLATVRR